MARASRNSKLETRTQRSKLKTSHRPYWTGIGQGLYLGYRKGTKGGAWIARYYHNKKYITDKIGRADDFQDSNNIDILNYFQAQEKVREFANDQTQKLYGTTTKPLTIEQAINNYLEWFKSHKKSYEHIKLIIRAHILPTLGNHLISELTPGIIRKWHESLIQQPPRLRSTELKQNFAKIQNTTDAIRKRKATANRILTILKAALNHAWRDGSIGSDDAWRKVKPFQKVNAPKIRYLDLSECQRLINACDTDFRLLVRAALLTGCRYGELTRLKINDFHASQGSIHVTETKNDKPRYVPLTIEGQEFFDQVTIGKLGNNLIFVRADGNPWGKSHQSRRLKKACKIAKIEPVISFHILRHTYGSLLASKGVPLQVIAELLGHADTRITQRHYAHLMPSFVSDTLRANLPNFIKNEKMNIRELKIKQ